MHVAFERYIREIEESLAIDVRKNRKAIECSAGENKSICFFVHRHVLFEIIALLKLFCFGARG